MPRNEQSVKTKKSRICNGKSKSIVITEMKRTVHKKISTVVADEKEQGVKNGKTSQI